MTRALVIGGGPAGLIAAEALLDAGIEVTLADHKPSLGRKFLMAGKSGLNLTRIEEPDRFQAAYGNAADRLAPMLARFGPEEVRIWASTLGQATFTGSTGRLFPVVMKASPLLRAWLARLDGKGLDRHARWHWQGWDGRDVLFDTPDGPRRMTPDATVLALGGASWARLGSDGVWATRFRETGLPLSPFAASNAGISVAWSAHMAPHFGAPLKALAFRAGDIVSRGEAILTRHGLEGGGVYKLAPAIREGHALTIDLAPDLDLPALTNRLSRPRGKQSLSNHLRKTLHLAPQAQALLMEVARPLPSNPAALAQIIKALPVPHDGLRPMDEAISTVGGVPWEALDAGLMLKDRPGLFCAGEMIDWDAPTGGYLITACLATGLWAGEHAARYCQR